MRESKGLYEYVATYVDDLCIIMREPLSLIKTLEGAPYDLKFKGTGPLKYHLGCGFEKGEDGILQMNPLKYIQKMEQGFKLMFNEEMSGKFHSPLEPNDHPELDTSELLEADEVQKYQSLIGSLQWLITLGRFDIQTAVMTLSSFRALPRRGHLERAKRICKYVSKFRFFTIKFKPLAPDLSMFDNSKPNSWESIYGEGKEDLPQDAPPPLGKPVTLVHFFDASLMHDVITGKAVTGTVHLANGTPVMWHSKKQATVETATYGAEFCAGRTCIEQVVDLRNTFRYLGVPVHQTSYVFGDNKSMIDSAVFPHSRLHKRHNILSFHYVRCMISKGFISLNHVPSEDNLADIVTKHWSYSGVYKRLLKPIFHYVGNTSTLYIDDMGDDEMVS
jgi:hypothetical protein